MQQTRPIVDAFTYDTVKLITETPVWRKLSVLVRLCDVLLGEQPG